MLLELGSGMPQLAAGSGVEPRVDDLLDPWVVGGPEKPENAKALPTLLTLEQSLNEGVNHLLIKHSCNEKLNASFDCVHSIKGS